MKIEHYKGDLHLFNLKQKLKGKPIVSADEFEKLTDISSISGSDDSEEEKSSSDDTSDDDIDDNDNDDVTTQPKRLNKAKSAIVAKNKPKLMFKLIDSTVLVLFKCILLSKKV